MQAVILAAGLGKRLHPLTTNRTKAMAPIAGKPIIEWVMNTITEIGVHDFIVVKSPDDKEIESYFREVSKIDAEVNFVTQSQPLGMGHALLQAVPQIPGDFILSACDNLIDRIDLQKISAVWENEKPDAILSTLRVGPTDIVRMGIIEIDGNRVKMIVEKPSLDDAPSNIGSVPLYFFSQDVIQYLYEIPPSPRGEYELQDAIQLLIDQGSLVLAFELLGRQDLTKPDDLLTLNISYLSNEKIRLETNLRNVGKGTDFINPILIESDVTIGANCLIGPNVYIEKGVKIGDSVHLEDVVVLRNRKIDHGEVIREKIIW